MAWQKEHGEPVPSGNGGPYSARVYPNHRSEYKIFEVKPTSCLPRKEIGESLYKYLESAIKKQNAQFNYEAKYLSSESDAKETRTKMKNALQACKNIGNENLNKVIDAELAKFDVEPAYGRPGKSGH
jgi:hypothetical protein